MRIGSVAWVPWVLGSVALSVSCSGEGRGAVGDVDVAADADLAPDVDDTAAGDGVDLAGHDLAESGGPDAADPGATDDGPDAVADVPPAPQCAGDFCAAGPEHAPDPAAWGPFPVGVRTYVFVDEAHPNHDGSPRVLKTEVWYPTEDDQRGLPKWRYDPKADAPEELRLKIGDFEIGSAEVNAVKDAPVRRGIGRFPLVLFSHGAFGIRYQSFFFTIPLASHGYVVVAPDHQLNTLYDLLLDGYDPTGFGYSMTSRTTDVLFLLDRFAAKDADPADDFFGTVDTDHVGIAGHSFGGFTCFAAAAQDPRVRAMIPMSPVGEIIVVSGVAPEDWHVPVLVMGGRMDQTLEFVNSFWNPWLALGTPKWFLGLARGGHYTFSDICLMDLKEVATELGYPDAAEALEDGCGPENWAFEEAHQAVNLYGIALFNTILRRSPGSAAFLTPEAGARFGDEIEFLAASE